MKWQRERKKERKKEMAKDKYEWEEERKKEWNSKEFNNIEINLT